MRLWTLHPKYLDVRGLVALWRKRSCAERRAVTGIFRNCAAFPGWPIRPPRWRLI